MLRVMSPVAGKSLAVSDVPDPVFARGLVGPGVAILPRGGPQRAVAPISGKLVKLHPHAYVIVASSGEGVLVHLGVDTVHMAGDSFQLHANESDQVETGDAILTWDPDYISGTGRSAVCSVVVLDCEPTAMREHAVGVDVTPKDLLFEVDC